MWGCEENECYSDESSCNAESCVFFLKSVCTPGTLVFEIFFDTDSIFFFFEGYTVTRGLCISSQLFFCASKAKFLSLHFTRWT